MSIKDEAIDANQVTGDTLQLKFVPISALSKLDEVLLQKNYKKHDIGGLWESIERYGFQNPAKFDSNLNGGKGGLVFGNGRTEAIVSMLTEARRGGKEPPRGVATNKDGEWCVPVLFGVDQINEAMARALAIDDNNLTVSGSDFTAWDMAKMWEIPSYVANLADIAEFGVTPITVDEDAIASLLTGLSGYGEEEENNASQGEDDVDAVLDAADAGDYVVRVKDGEIWKLGRHSIACGDCTEVANVEKFMKIAGLSDIDGCWTDPPYGVAYEGKTKDKMVIQNDKLSKDDLLPFLLNAFAGVKYACKAGA